MIYLELLKDIPVTAQGYMKAGTVKTEDEWCNIIGREPGSIVWENKLTGSDNKWWKIVKQKL
jgi:hypothetical protein